MDAVFAVMPFADIARPALGVSLLAALARAAGFSVGIEYCNIALAEIIGPELYQRVASSFPPDLLLGEWFFADDIFGDSIPDDRTGNLVLTLAAELKENGVTANIIQVRAIDVDNKGTGTTPAEIVAAMQYLFSDEASKITGARIPLY